MIVCPLVFLGGFIDSVAGGGGLVTLPAYMLAGLPVHFAIGTNKISSAMGTSLSTYRYAKDGFIPWRIAGFCVVCALLGSALGASLTLLIDDGALKIIMLFLLPLTAVYVAKSKALVQESTPFDFGKTALLSSVIAFVIGIYDGFYGPGTGTFLILLLTVVAHMSAYSANGTAKVINLSTNISALAVFIVNGKVIYALGIVAGLFSIAGNYIGTRYFEKGGSKAVKPLMICVLCIFFIKVFYEVFFD